MGFLFRKFKKDSGVKYHRVSVIRLVGLLGDRLVGRLDHPNVKPMFLMWLGPLAHDVDSAKKVAAYCILFDSLGGRWAKVGFLNPMEIRKISLGSDGWEALLWRLSESASPQYLHPYRTESGDSDSMLLVSLPSAKDLTDCVDEFVKTWGSPELT